MRHETQQHGRTPYALWRDDQSSFEAYQNFQLSHRRAWFKATHWASFVVSPDGKTIFAGVYQVEFVGPPANGAVDPLSGGVLNPDWIDAYDARKTDLLAEYIGRLVIDWGVGTRTWVQLAANQDKPIVELSRAFIEPSFPGFFAFTAQLSELSSLPPTWKSVLQASRGVYLLTCPKTKEQYVGSATGADGFLGRWRGYVDGGDGGNLGLRIRAPSDYRVSILQVAGSSEEKNDVLAIEAIWKQKLQSREMGLNRN